MRKFGNDRKMLKQRNPINWGWGEAFYPPTGYLYTPEGWFKTIKYINYCNRDCWFWNIHRIRIYNDKNDSYTKIGKME